jgi:hypothetical protein
VISSLIASIRRRCVWISNAARDHPQPSRYPQFHGNPAPPRPSDCFELWLILHFQDHAAWLDNAGAWRLRRQLDGAPDKSLDPGRYMPHVTDAARREADLHGRHQRDGVTFPKTTPLPGCTFSSRVWRPPKASAAKAAGESRRYHQVVWR